jgi:hypothetical protein
LAAPRTAASVEHRGWIQDQKTRPKRDRTAQTEEKPEFVFPTDSVLVLGVDVRLFILRRATGETREPARLGPVCLLRTHDDDEMMMETPL